MAETDKNKKPSSYVFKPSLKKTLSKYNILKVLIGIEHHHPEPAHSDNQQQIAHLADRDIC